MLCGCTKPVEPRATSTTPDVDVLRQRFDGGRRLVVPSPPSLRHCFSARVRPSSATTGFPAAETTQSDESLGLGAEARPRTRSYTLTDGATSAIGRILTCFQDTEASSDDVTRPRPRSRSLWSRRRSPVSCLKTSTSGVGGGCVVDVVLDCSPGSVRRRRLETQSAASTSSTLHGDAVWNSTKVTSEGSEASCELTTLCHSAHPVWERRQLQRGRRRLTEPARQRAAPTTDIPPARGSTSVTHHGRSTTSTGDSTPSRRRITRRAMTCVVPRPQVRVVQSASSGGQQGKTENEDSTKVTMLRPVSSSLELDKYLSESSCCSCWTHS